MIDEASEVLVEFNGALARVEIVGSDEAARAAKAISQAAAQIGLRLRNSYLSGQPADKEAGNTEERELKRRVEDFAALCRRELAHPE
jgi:hypothetical protein